MFVFVRADFSGFPAGEGIGRGRRLSHGHEAAGQGGTKTVRPQTDTDEDQLSGVRRVGIADRGGFETGDGTGLGPQAR